MSVKQTMNLVKRKAGGVLIAVLSFITFSSFKLSKVDSVQHRTVIPLTIDYDQRHRRVTPLIQVGFNNTLVTVVFDTGSSGLRLLKGAINPGMFDSYNRRAVYRYGGGSDTLKVSGYVTGSHLAFGDLKNNIPIMTMLIDSLKYGDNRWSPTKDSTRVESAHLRGVQGIIGVGMRSATYGVDNPLAQLPGNGSYIVHFPSFGYTQGKVIINPSDSDLLGFTYFHLTHNRFLLPNGLPSWADDQLNGTISINGRAVKVPTMIDSGTSSTEIYIVGLSNRYVLPANSKVQFALSGISDAEAMPDYSFYVVTQIPGKDRVVINAANKNHAIWGTNIFFNFDVLYDQAHGIIGLRKKPEAK